MLDKIEKLFENSLVCYVCKGIAITTAVISGLLTFVALIAALFASAWWFVAALVVGTCCGASIGFYGWLDN